MGDGGYKIRIKAGIHFVTEAGIVDRAEDYLYSSARDYYGTGKGLLNIILF